MYSTIDDIVAYGKSGDGTRPLIMCEYSHAMGNSNGSLADYWDAFENTPGLQGGFVWEWKDHGLTQCLPNGTTRLAYGGQFGDTPNDGNFVADGLIHADMTPHPVMRELAWVHRPISVELKSKNKDPHLVVRNRQWFSDLSAYKGAWELLVDGVVTKSGKLTVPKVAPDSSEKVDIPVIIPHEANEVFFSVTWTLARDTPWAPKGHVVSWDQVTLRKSAPVEAAIPDTSILPIDISPQVTLWRAPVDNDGFKLMDQHHGGGKSLARWSEQGITTDDADMVESTTTITELSGGAVRYEHTVVIPKEMADVPRVGAMFSIPARFTTVRWYGNGPHECYPDRESSAMVGIYEGKPDELPYLVPQEFGLRTDCRWMEFIDAKKGHVLRVEADGCLLHMSAVHHSAHDLFAASEHAELVRQPALNVHLDIAHRGVGTASCGPDTLAKYLIAPGEYTFAYVVSYR
jgi:beta-galactosidase